MKTRQKLFLGLIGILLVMFVTGILYWYPPVQTSPKTQSLGKIILTWSAWPGTLPHFVAYEKGFFAKEGLEAEITRVESYTEEMDAFLSGKSDFIGSIVLVDLLELVIKGHDLKVIGVMDYSNGADGIVAKRGIQTVADLKGRKVAVEKGTLGEYLLYAALERVNLSLKDIKIENMTVPNGTKAFIDGRIDAAVLWEPELSKAEREGNGLRIFTSADTPKLIVDCLAVRKDYLENNPDKVRAMLKAIFKAVEFIHSHPKESYQIGGKYFNVSPSEFEEQIKGVKLFNKRDNVTAFSYGAGFDSLYGNGEFAKEYLKKMGRLKRDVKMDEVVVRKFVMELDRK